MRAVTSFSSVRFYIFFSSVLCTTQFVIRHTTPRMDALFIPAFFEYISYLFVILGIDSGNLSAPARERILRVRTYTLSLVSRTHVRTEHLVLSRPLRRRGCRHRRHRHTEPGSGLPKSQCGVRGGLVGLEQLLLFLPHLGTKGTETEHDTREGKSQSKQQQRVQRGGKYAHRATHNKTKKKYEEEIGVLSTRAPKTTQTRILSWRLALLPAYSSCPETTVAASTIPLRFLPLNATSATAILTPHQTTHFLKIRHVLETTRRKG